MASTLAPGSDEKLDLKTTAALFVTVFSWGTAFVASKFALESLSPAMLLFFRFSLASVIFFAILLIRKTPRRSWKDHRAMMAMAIFQPGLYFLFETTGLQRTSASITSLIIAAIPVVVVLFSRLFLKESLTAKKLLGALVSVGGVALLVLSDLSSAGSESSLEGNVLVSLAVVAGASYVIISRKLGERIGPLELTGYQMLYGSLMALPFFTAELVTTGLPQFDLALVGSLAFLVLGATFAAFLSYNYALSKIPASRASVPLNAIPLVTVVGAALLLGEGLSLIQWIGAGVILGGVVVTVR